MKFHTTISKAITGLAAVVCLIASGDFASGKEPSGKSPHEQLIGYWAPDKAELLKMMKEEMAKSGQAANPQALAFAEQMVEKMVGSMVAEFTKDSTIMHGGGAPEPQKSNYTVKSQDAASGTLVVEVTDEQGQKQEGKAIITGDKMVMVADQSQKMHMNRITKAEFEKRIAAAKKAAEGAGDALQKALEAAEGAKPKAEVK